MALRLTVVAGPDVGQVFPLTPGVPLLVGRGEVTPTRLTDPRVSRVHCAVELAQGQVTVIDSGSTAGTLVNGAPVRRHALGAGDVIAVGKTRLRLDDDDRAAERRRSASGSARSRRSG